MKNIQEQLQQAIAAKQQAFRKGIADRFIGIDNDLEKAEGSRGGKVIGHTKSGKPIYQSAVPDLHKDFTRGEHKEANDLRYSSNGKVHNADNIKPIKKDIRNLDEAKRAVQSIDKDHYGDQFHSYGVHTHEHDGHGGHKLKLVTKKGNVGDNDNIRSVFSKKFPDHQSLITKRDDSGSNGEVHIHLIKKKPNQPNIVGNKVEKSIQFYTEESIQQYITDLNKAMESEEVSQEDFEKGMKNLSHLTKKTMTDKNGVVRTIYVSNNTKMSDHQMKNHISEKHGYSSGSMVDGKVLNNWEEAANHFGYKKDGEGWSAKSTVFNPNGIMQKKDISNDELIEVAKHVSQLSHINRVRFDKMWKDVKLETNPMAAVPEIAAKMKAANDDIEIAKTLKRGGDAVLGNTTSGKPIHIAFDHENHKDFTATDHRDASSIKAKLVDRLKGAKLIGDKSADKLGWERHVGKGSYLDDQEGLSYKQQIDKIASENNKSTMEHRDGIQQGGYSKAVFESPAFQNYAGGYGAIYHNDRNDERDAALEGYLRKKGLNDREIGAFLISSVGRHAMDNMATNVWKVGGDSHMDKQIGTLIPTYKKMLTRLGGIEAFETED